MTAVSRCTTASWIAWKTFPGAPHRLPFAYLRFRSSLSSPPDGTTRANQPRGWDAKPRIPRDSRVTESHSRRHRGRRTPVLPRSRREKRRAVPSGGSSGPWAAVPTRPPPAAGSPPDPERQVQQIQHSHATAPLGHQRRGRDSRGVASCVTVRGSQATGEGEIGGLDDRKSGARRELASGEELAACTPRGRKGTRGLSGEKLERDRRGKTARAPLRATGTGLDWGIHRRQSGGEGQWLRWGPGHTATEGRGGQNPNVGGQSRIVPTPVDTESQGGLSQHC